METISRGTGGDCNELQRRYELSVYLDIRHLGSLCTTYLKIYGEELVDYKLHRLVADLLLGVFSQSTSSQSHRWISTHFPDGFFFIQRFEEEARKTLQLSLPLWREYEPESVELTIEHNLASTFIGFRHMFENVNQNTLTPFSLDDQAITRRMTPVFEQEVIIDFRNNMQHQIQEVEIQSIGSGHVTWAYLVEESMRINLELLQRNHLATTMDVDSVVALLDVNEMRSRFERTELMTRLITVADAYAADTVFDNMLLDLAGIISRIVYSNSDTLRMITDQLTMRASAMGINGTVSIHCTNFQWLGQAAVVRFGVFTLHDTLGIVQ